MKNSTMSKYFFLLLIIVTGISSCSKHEDKEPVKKDSLATTASDTHSTLQVKPAEDDEQADAFLPYSPGQVIPSPSKVTELSRTAPIGSTPILRSEQMTEFHPRLPDFIIANAEVRDEEKESQSVLHFKFRSDTTRSLRSTIMDINEAGASKLISEITAIQKNKQETRVVGGEAITSYYLEIKGMPAIKAYIPSKELATLFIVVGDHSAISLKEWNVRSADHLIEAAKTIDFKKFETLTRK